MRGKRILQRPLARPRRHRAARRMAVPAGLQTHGRGLGGVSSGATRFAAFIDCTSGQVARW